MKISQFNYTIKESIKNLWRNRMMSFASMSSVAATLLILGIIFILIINISSLAQGAKDQFDTIQVYLVDELEGQEVETVGQQLYALEGVKEIYFETKQDALNKMKMEWEDNGYLLEGLEENPLPNSYIVTLYDIGYSDYVVEEIQKISGVEEVKFYQDVVMKIIEITNYIKNIGMVIIFILVAISTFIIHNTIKLAVNARRREIGIMKYVGATSWFVRWPFLLEGTLLGIFGAVLAIGVLHIGYAYTYSMFTSKFYVLIAAYLVSAQTITADLLVIFIVIGAGIGALGSLLSMRRYLQV
ncbi:permease-like cell division protein FtsX [Fusibacter sp. JL216-2]|uniref:permease-like cell division protein FtsX n=1 Tax=Fusibacter sp. JL216-2 TaxID=3071453 RepID=UPI003D327489